MSATETIHQLRLDVRRLRAEIRGYKSWLIKERSKRTLAESKYGTLALKLGLCYGCGNELEKKQVTLCKKCSKKSTFGPKSFREKP